MKFTDEWYDKLYNMSERELVEFVKDAEGEAGACSDRECSCKSVAGEARQIAYDRGLEEYLR